MDDLKNLYVVTTRLNHSDTVLARVRHGSREEGFWTSSEPDRVWLMDFDTANEIVENLVHNQPNVVRASKAMMSIEAQRDACIVMPGDEETILYHPTSSESLEDIMRDGLRPGAYLLRYDVANHHFESMKDQGQDIVLLAICAKDIINSKPAPDMRAIKGSQVFLPDINREDLRKSWKGSTKTWRDSLHLMGSIRCNGSVPAKVISVPDVCAVEVDDESLSP